MSFGQMLDEKPGIRIFVDAKCCHRSFCRCRQINFPHCTMQSQLILVWQHVFIFYAAKRAHVASRFLVRFMAFMPDVVAFLEPLRFVTLPDLAGRGVECSPHGSTGGCSRLVWWCLAYIPQIGFTLLKILRSMLPVPTIISILLYGAIYCIRIE